MHSWSGFVVVAIVSFADGTDVFKKLSPRMEATHVMEVAQLLLSLIHSWGIDLHLDKVCETQLGLLRPMVSPYIEMHRDALEFTN